MTKTAVSSDPQDKNGWRLPDSIYLKCVLMLAVSAALTIGLMTFKSMRASQMIANTSTVTIGTEVTKQLAERNLAALRFRKSDDIAEVLRTTVDDLAGSAAGALVIAADGEVLAQEFINNSDASPAMEAARNVLETGEMAVNEERLVIALPMRIGPEQQLIGAIALDWQSEILYMAVAEQNRSSLLLAVGLGVGMLLIVGFLLKRMVGAPLLAIASAMNEVAQGNYETEIPKYRRGNEVGVVARALEQFRDQLSATEATRKDAAMKSTALDAGSAAIMIADADFNIQYASNAVLELLQNHKGLIASRISGFDPDTIVGQSIDFFHKRAEMQRTMLSKLGEDGHKASLEMDGVTLELNISKIDNDAGERIGYVIEWADVTEQRLNSAVLKSLDMNQARAEFDHVGQLVDANPSFLALVGTQDLSQVAQFDQTVFLGDQPVDPASAAFSEFEIKRTDGETSQVLGGLSPVFNSSGDLKRTVLIGADVTKERHEKRASEQERQRLEAEQDAMIAALSNALSVLADGDLSVRISQAFAGANDRIRSDFNLAVERLEEAIQAVSVSSTTIRAEVSGVADATVSLSRRTEHQAATLQETASALVELSASVSSSAEGAKNADEIVGQAQLDATNSGRVVEDAVSAMGQIAESSTEITSIVQVIDDIAFQTNLLALNAGVEAARAGDAGRGFAVVASEVRALAQRSSEAANEISSLISSASQSVDLGVELVGEAGQALTKIVASISDISGHVSQIATASKEQSMGLSEISSAMSQLDQVTQENAAMFEETSAASQTLSQTTTDLTQRVERFKTTSVETTNGSVAEPHSADIEGEERLAS